MRRKRTYKQLLSDIREKAENNVIHDMTFVYQIPESEKQSIGEEQKRRFRLWWDSWIEPKLKELEERLCK